MRKTALPLLLWLVVLLAVAPASSARAAELSKTLTGTIVRVQASEHAVSVKLPDGTESRFLWNADTRISGILTPGARVTIRYAEGADGKMLALQITVPRG